MVQPSWATPVLYRGTAPWRTVQNNLPSLPAVQLSCTLTSDTAAFHILTVESRNHEGVAGWGPSALVSILIPQFLISKSDVMD